MQLCFYCRDWSQETDRKETIAKPTTQPNLSYYHWQVRQLKSPYVTQATWKKAESKTQKWKFKQSDPSCGRAPQYKFILSPHCASQFPLEKRLMQSGCYSAPPLNTHYLVSTKPSSRVEAWMWCYSSNNLHDTWPRHYRFSLQLMCMACQAPGWGVALSSLLGSHLFQPFG